MEQEEEKKDIADIVNPAILEAFDGDLEEWMEWNQKAEEFKEQVKEEAEEDDGIERQLTADGRSVEWFNIRADQTAEEYEEYEQSGQENQSGSIPMQETGSIASDASRGQTERLKKDMGSADGTSVNGLRPETERLTAESSYHPYQGQPGVLTQVNNYGNGQNGYAGNQTNIHPIDINDPHYVNYKPDPYYEYGIGPEPKRPRGNGTGPGGLAIASMVCGIGSIVLIFCGYGIPLSIVSMVLGSIALSRKEKTTGGKAMSIIGITLSALSAVSMLAWIVYMIVVN